MHLSRLRIKNFRSVKELDIAFKKGKNIIVGKNNAGKSNIVKAIDILLGETSPTFQRADNISEIDFYNGEKQNDILLFCVLEREDGEILNYDEIYRNCFGFRVHEENFAVPSRHIFSPNSLPQFWIDLNNALNIGEEDVRTRYISRKDREAHAFENQFEDKYIFAFAFRASFQNNKIVKECRLFYKENKVSQWIMSFSVPIRTELIQSAIIPSFRDPQNELRLNQWSWYGKLLRKHINADDPALREAFENVKSASNSIFQGIVEGINNQQVKVAFPDTSISFQLNPDSKIDVYKSTLIYVNDGFNSQLQDKGSGIQSAVIIGLFHFYTRNYNHLNCSLLAIEEPELYLHPQARRVISDRINDFLEGNKNQVILTTHSAEFITSAHENVNIISLRKDRHHGTVGTNATFDDSKERQILTKSQNVEMFFADKVVLVEGGEKYIIEAAAKLYGKHVKSYLGENWLNDKNISVIAVGGKTEFSKYYNKLSELKIECYVLADFDFLLRQFANFLTAVKPLNYLKDRYNGLNGKIKNNRELAQKIIDKISEFNHFLQKEGLAINEKELKSKLKDPFRLKKLNQISEDAQPIVVDFIDYLKAYNVFIFSGELEDFFTEDCKQSLRSIQGKEERPIYIVSQLINQPEELYIYINCKEYFELFDLITVEYTLEEEIADIPELMAAAPDPESQSHEIKEL